MPRMILALAVCGVIVAAVPAAGENETPEAPPLQSAPAPLMPLVPPGPHDDSVAQAPLPVVQETPQAEVKAPENAIVERAPVEAAPAPVVAAPLTAPQSAPLAQAPAEPPQEKPGAESKATEKAAAESAPVPDVASPLTAPQSAPLAQAPAEPPQAKPQAEGKATEKAATESAPAEAAPTPLASPLPPAPQNGAAAESKPVESADGRYTFSRMNEGYVRLDNRTGQVSFCSKRTVGWTCQLAPEDRGVLESEITRLQEENVTLKKEFLARGVPLPGATKPEPPPAAQNERPFGLPKDPDLERAKVFVEKVWRRLVDMISTLQKEVLKKS